MSLVLFRNACSGHAGCNSNKSQLSVWRIFNIFGTVCYNKKINMSTLWEIWKEKTTSGIQKYLMY